MELQMQLTRTGIPLEFRRASAFFEQAHIKDIACYLRLLINPFDEVAWKRILKLLPRIGVVRAQKTFSWMCYPLPKTHCASKPASAGSGGSGSCCCPALLGTAVQRDEAAGADGAGDVAGNTH